MTPTDKLMISISSCFSCSEKYSPCGHHQKLLDEQKCVSVRWDGNSWHTCNRRDNHQVHSDGSSKWDEFGERP